jgi:release factor glutamine methyltransferase
MDVRSLFKEGIHRLRAAEVPSETLAAELLLLYVLGRERAWLYAHPEEPVDQGDRERFFELIRRRAAGEPLQHLTGKQEFWGLEFQITPDVLIPRPETEHVVEVALDRLALRELRAGRRQKTQGENLLIADVGTGSGCIAVALAKELPLAHFVATDISAAALVVARRNAERHGVAGRMRFAEADLLEERGSPPSGDRAFDLIVSNPPYVGRREAQTLTREVREHEPEVALFGGEDGYEMYAQLVQQAADRLKNGGLLVVELGYNSLPAVAPLLDAQHWRDIAATSDLAGIARVLAAELTAPPAQGRS